MKILYGTSEKNIDVTQICYKYLNIENKISIPLGDEQRSNYFSDPVYGTLKKIFIIDDNNKITEYDDKTSIFINLQNNHELNNIVNNVDNKIMNIHRNLIIKYGSFYEELPEQKMAVRYLAGDEKVLEIGGNIGRNSLVIAYILGNNMNNFVTLECDEDICNQLRENRDLNNMPFHIENSALSKRNLIQKGWDTIVSEEVLVGYKKVNTITYEEFKMKYNINFDTLVLDCEGAFYYILQDMPEILHNIKLIIMENDYKDITHKQYIDNILIKNKFYVDYREAGGWGPCYNCFFEVWKR